VAVASYPEAAGNHAPPDPDGGRFSGQRGEDGAPPPAEAASTAPSGEIGLRVLEGAQLSASARAIGRESIPL
jgi:hypothetical protein